MSNNDDEGSVGELKLHEIDFNKLLQRLGSTDEDDGDSSKDNHKKMKHRRHHRHHRKKKTRKRHHKISSQQQQQNIQYTNNRMESSSSQKKDVTTSNKQSSSEMYTKFIHKTNPKISMKMLTSSSDTIHNVPSIQTFMGRGVKPTPHAPLRKRIVPEKEQFLVLFHKNTTSSPLTADRQHVSLEGSQKTHRHEVIVVNDIKAFHRLESISPAAPLKGVYDIERTHSVESDSHQKRASVKDNHQHLNNRKRVPIESQLMKINNTAGEQNHTQQSEPDNHVNKLTTTDEQSIVASIDNIGKSIGSIKTNVSDSNLLSSTFVARDFAKPPTNYTVLPINSSSSITNNLSEAKSTNESILRNVVHGIQNNTTTLQNNTNEPMEFTLININNNNNTQDDTNSKEFASNESLINVTKPRFNHVSIPSANYKNITTDMNNLISQQQEHNSLPYNNTNNNLNYNPNNNNNLNKINYNNATEVQQLNQTQNLPPTTPPDLTPETTKTTSTITNEKSPQTTNNITSNEQIQNINSQQQQQQQQQGLIDVFIPPDTNTDMMQITNKNQTNGISSDINVPLVPLKNNETESNYNNELVLTNDTNTVLDTKLKETQQINSALKEIIDKNIAVGDNFMFNSNQSLGTFNTTNNQMITNTSKPSSEIYNLPQPSTLTNSSTTPGVGEDLMSISDHQTVSFKVPTSSLYETAPRRKSIIPTPDPRDRRLAREYIPIYSNPSSSNSYGEEDSDFLDGPSPKQFIGGNSVDKSETTSLKNFLEDERLEEQSITYEANSANNVRPHHVKVVDPIQRALNERKKQGKIFEVKFYINVYRFFTHSKRLFLSNTYYRVLFIFSAYKVLLM